MIKEHELKNGVYAQMGSSYVFSAMADYLSDIYKCDKLDIFKKLLQINAKVCEDRYGGLASEWMKDTSNYISTNYSNVEVALFTFTFKTLLDKYLSDPIDNINEKTYTLVNKLYNYFYRKKIYNSKECYYFNNFIYVVDNDSYEKKLVQDKFNLFLNGGRY